MSEVKEPSNESDIHFEIGCVIEDISTKRLNGKINTPNQGFNYETNQELLDSEAYDHK